MLVAVLSGLLMIAYTGFQLERERTAVIKRAERQTENFARVLEEHSRQTLHRVAASLAQADAELWPLHRAGRLDVAQSQRLLTQLLPADRLIQNVLLLGPGGALVLSSQNESGWGYAAGVDSDYFAPHVRGADRELVFGSPVKAADGQWLLPVSRRFGRVNGAAEGVLVAMVRAAYFSVFLRLHRAGTGWFGNAVFIVRGSRSHLPRDRCGYRQELVPLAHVSPALAGLADWHRAPASYQGWTGADLQLPGLE